MSSSPFRQLRLLTLPLVGFLFLVSQAVMAAGSGTIKGRVLDKDSGDPLPGANVIVQGTSLGAATNPDGGFTLLSVPAGMQILAVSYVGYESVNSSLMIAEDTTINLEFRLTPQVIPGEPVVITAQAQGQNAAINQQLASNTIANIVSSARIKELPDVNAAESIGRLPGVAINRYNGEATTVVIRGLSAKYNAVTVNGVALPATGADDRSVDLSLISSNMLDGIEVKKANTPDMDASALGGTVDLKLREAPVEPVLNLSAQMGYNNLQDYYGNYQIGGNWSRRFLDNDLGVIATVNADHYNRSADKFQGNYVTVANTNAGIQSVELRDETVMRTRAGGSLLADYVIPSGKVTLSGFLNQLQPEDTYRVNQPDREHGSHYYTFEQDKSKTNIFTTSLGVKQDFDLFKYDISISRTGSYTDDPNDHQWGFAQENGAFPNAPITTPPFQLPSLETVDSNKTGFQSAYIYSTKRWEFQDGIQLNLQAPFTIIDELSGYLKVGGAYRWLNRRNDQDQWGRDGLQYGQTSVNAPLTAALTRAAQMYPQDFNWPADSTLCRAWGQLPITRFLDRGYHRNNFLGGTWPQGMVANFNLLNEFTNALSGSSEWKYYGVGSLGSDYSGIERYQATYVMSELKIGEIASLLPGVRWERYFTAYHGQVFRDNKVSNVEQAPVDYSQLYIERDNQYLMPMVHLIVTPAEWMKLRFARTQSLTQPDYIMYAPITSMNSDNNYCRAANSQLKPARSYNWDAAASVYDNTVGLFTLSGFYKDIYDLILQSTINYQQPQSSDDPGIPLPSGLNIPNNWLRNNSFQIDTYTNNPARAIYKGYEIEWQTHFWYLPSVLSGLVLNANYTRIYSQTYKQIFNIVKTNIPIGNHRPPVYKKILVESSRYARMPDQPAHTANISLGYDYEGFSGRVIWLYQSDRTSFISTDPTLDTFIAAYYRMDITLAQKIGYGLQVYANLNNLNNRHDQTYVGYTMADPSYLEYYGFTMDVGVRFTL